jgi:phosphate transport system substrate-binding protein
VKRITGRASAPQTRGVETKVKKTTIILTLAAAGLLVLAFGACKQVEKPSASGTALTGNIQVKGSDTLLMLSQRWAEDFMTANKGAVIQVSGGGSGAGITALIDGTTNVCNASRPIKDEEKAKAAAKGVTPFEVKVALDGIAIVVNPANPVNELTMAQLKDIYMGKAKDWKAVGGTAGKIMCYGRQNSSGTYAYFQEKVLGKTKGPDGKEVENEYRPDIQEMTGTSLLCDTVAKDKMAIAYVGVGYANRRKDVKIVAVKKDDKAPAVKPDNDAVVDGSYPLSRYLFNYTNGKPTGVTRAFILYCLSAEAQKVVAELEYIPLPEDVRAAEEAKVK